MKRVLANIYEYFRQCDTVLWLLTLTAIAYSFLLIASMQRSGNYGYLRTLIAAVSSDLLQRCLSQLPITDFLYENGTLPQ